MGPRYAGNRPISAGYVLTLQAAVDGIFIETLALIPGT